MTSFHSFTRTGSVFAVAAGLALPGGGVTAQEADFLFKTPRASFGIYGGYAVASAGSGIFDETREMLTVDRSDFDSGLLGVQLGIRATERVEVSLRAGVARSETRSEYRDFVDLDNLPIEQSTVFRRVPVTANVKYYFDDRGRSVGRFAWIPRAVVPYVGVGGGWTWYRFEQTGDWIDFTDDEWPIRRDTFLSDGAAPTARVLGGVDVSLGPRWFLTGEGGYTWASAPMDRGFDDSFGDIDLGGFQVTVGVSARF